MGAHYRNFARSAKLLSKVVICGRISRGNFYRDRQSRLVEFLFSTFFGAATIKVVQIIARTTENFAFGDQLALRGSQHTARSRNKLVNATKLVWS